MTGHRWRADAVTLPAVDLGADVKVDLVEIDVHLTSDGELVVIHDTGTKDDMHPAEAVAG